MTTPRIFVTDLASYTEGSQYEFGHWVNLNDFNNATEIKAYISDHLKECDKKRPLFDGLREEPMITDYEDIPEILYSETNIDFVGIYKYLEIVEDHPQEAVEAFLESGLFSHEDYVDLEESFTDSYKGTYKNDEEFAKEMAYDIGCFDEDVQWPFTCIDWSLAACDIMVYYVAINKHYFKVN